MIGVQTTRGFQNCSGTKIKRPRSYQLANKSSLYLPTNELYNYLACVDKLVLRPSKIFNHFLFIYNSSGQLVLKVFKCNRIFLLKDLHDRTLWNIQITKNSWALRPSEAHVSARNLRNFNEKLNNLCHFQVQDASKGSIAARYKLSTHLTCP